ncbi:hypothetical protein AUR64_11085 [Haloprofundus marisrubri]|uniref:Uncharacterized protein n=1 Tax=Haloprofundus marisrubri TaxID=1514971 RepID=A0A0W1R915_9EURY|nr:DUF5794 domain-containing protein [Haloprofundus marisrubri]KTG10132.1 hypothetical protein AUR64_11085 [Haloprofundus marisrubri]
MSVSQHPIALRLEQQVGGATRLLATVMALPLVDGIFPALVLAGALTTTTASGATAFSPVGIVETGLLIFGGSATMAVILAEMDGTPREQVQSVLLLGAVLIPLAAVEAALAGTIESLVDIAIFERFAGLVIIAIAAKTASAEIGEYLPGPAVIIGLGLVASFDPAGAQLIVDLDPVTVLAGAAAAGVGVGFALGVALFGDRLRGKVDIDLFRFGSSVALAMLALSVLGIMNTHYPVALGVLCVTAVFSYDPGSSDDSAVVDATEDDDSDDTAAAGQMRDASATTSAHEGPVADGGDAPQSAVRRSEEEEESGSAYGYPGEDDSRAPWL